MGYAPGVKIILYILTGILLGPAIPAVAGGWRAAGALEAQTGGRRAEAGELGSQGANLALEAEVRDLKEGYEALEERARAELGMVRRGETLYQIIERTDGAR